MSRRDAISTFSLHSLVSWFLLALLLASTTTTVSSFNLNSQTPPSSIARTPANDLWAGTSLNSRPIRLLTSAIRLTKGKGDGNDEPKTQLPLDKFRSLMGSLYGVAGLAHAADCYLGQSQLLTAAGSPPLSELPSAGQSLVALWCAAGPAAFVASRVGGLAADAGLVFYGVVEIAGAAVLVRSLESLAGSELPDIDALTNAISVQGIVLASWIYSRNKED